MEEISLINARRVWIKNVANTGSIPNAQCYKDAIQQICLGLSIAFCPAEDLDDTSSGKNESNEATMNAEAKTYKSDNNNIQSPESQPTKMQVPAQPQPASSLHATDMHTLTKKTTTEDDIEMMDRHIQEDGNVNMENGDAKTRDAEVQDADEHSASNSDQSNGKKVDKSSVIITGSAEIIKDIPKDASVTELAAQTTTSMNKLSHPTAFKIVHQPLYLTPLKLAYTQVRALYLELLYQDRFILLNNPDFLLFLAEQPQLSHAFLRHLINHPFGIRYLHRDGSNANHGITPFAYPFLPVDPSLPSGLFFENRWALLNDPTWLCHVSMEEFIMASFWAEMSFRGGLGVMKRRREVTERASDFAMAPF